MLKICQFANWNIYWHFIFWMKIYNSTYDFVRFVLRTNFVFRMYCLKLFVAFLHSPHLLSEYSNRIFFRLLFIRIVSTYFSTFLPTSLFHSYCLRTFSLDSFTRLFLDLLHQSGYYCTSIDCQRFYSNICPYFLLWRNKRSPCSPPGPCARPLRVRRVLVAHRDTKGPSTLATLFNHMWPRIVAGIFIPVGNHYFQALASTLQFVAQVCHRLWLVPATDRAFAYITYMSP